MNKTILIGRICTDIDLRYTSSNVPCTMFKIAINRQFENANGEKETDFISVVVWRKQAENVKKYCSKGNLVAIEGSIRTRTYDDKDGKKVYVTEVYADNVQFLESKKNEQEASKKEEPQKSGDEPYMEFANEQGNTIELTDDDIAF